MSYARDRNDVADDEFNQSAEDSSNEGGTRSYTKEEMSKHPAYDDAIDHNRTMFESGTFTGNTNNNDVKKALFGLKDGDSANFADDWERNVNAFDNISSPSKMNLTEPSTYFAFGRSGVRSDGNFTAKRSGDDLMISGNILNRLGSKDNETEAFDFNPGQPGSSEARVLERLGKAKPFAMDYRRRQTVQAQGRYEPDGTITVLKTLWGDLE